VVLVVRRIVRFCCRVSLHQVLEHVFDGVFVLLSLLRLPEDPIDQPMYLYSFVLVSWQIGSYSEKDSHAVLLAPYAANRMLLDSAVFADSDSDSVTPEVILRLLFDMVGRLR
jgi:hypothetical protein